MLSISSDRNVVDPKYIVAWRKEQIVVKNSTILPNMISWIKKFRLSSSSLLIEVLFQLSLVGLLIFFTYLNKNHPHLHLYEVVFLLLYFSAACLINYWLLPSFFYKKKPLQFFLGLLFVLAMVVILEEKFLEDGFELSYRQDELTFRKAIYTLIECSPVILLFVGIKFGWDILKQQTEVEKLKSAVAESELQFLKSQINPHFLFNNLNNVYAYALENSPKTPAIILELSSLLRYMLYDCRENYVPLEKEVKYLKDFVNLQELQIEDRGTINFSTKGNFESKLIAPLILIVFVENCFKHSTSSQSKGIIINVRLEIEGDILRMYCSNTYSDSKNTDHLSSGIGLENVKSRLELLYPDAHALKITQQNHFFNVFLQIKLN